MIRERSGDPRFLRVVLSALEKYCKLLGLDAVAGAAGERLDKQEIRAKATPPAWKSSIPTTTAASSTFARLLVPLLVGFVQFRRKAVVAF